MNLPLMKNSGLALLLILIVASCGPRKIVDEQTSFQRRCWPRTQELVYTFEVKDTAAGYDIGAKVSHFDNFPFDRVQLAFVLNDPSGETRISEHDLVIRNKEGRFLGKQRKDTLQLSFALRNRYRFKAPGMAKITLINRLPIDTTRGIGAIGISVSKVR